MQTVSCRIVCNLTYCVVLCIYCVFVLYGVFVHCLLCTVLFVVCFVSRALLCCMQLHCVLLFVVCCVRALARVGVLSGFGGSWGCVLCGSSFGLGLRSGFGGSWEVFWGSLGAILPFWGHLGEDLGGLGWVLGGSFGGSFPKMARHSPEKAQEVPWIHRHLPFGKGKTCRTTRPRVIVFRRREKAIAASIIILGVPSFGALR